METTKQEQTNNCAFEALSLVVQWLGYWNAVAKNNDIIYIRVDADKNELNMRILEVL